MSLAAANIQNNEEFLLSRKYRRNSSSSNGFLNDFYLTYEMTGTPVLLNKRLTGPTQREIDAATADVEEKHFKIPAVVNIDELVLQSDVRRIVNVFFYFPQSYQLFHCY